MPCTAIQLPVRTDSLQSPGTACVQVQSTFSVGLAEHLQAAAGAHASTASSLQTALAQATTLTETLAQDVQGTLQQLTERLGEPGCEGDKWG